MSDLFYINVAQVSNKIHAIYVENGERKKNKFDFCSDLYVNDPRGEYKTIYGKRFKKVELDSLSEWKRRIKSSEEIENEVLCGNPKPEFEFIHKHFPEEINFDMDHINIFYLDIEVWGDGTFPDPEEAKFPINAISVRHRNKTYSFILRYENQTVSSDREDVELFLFDTEEELMTKFIKFWGQSKVDIVSGWNVTNFDITYICKRIENIFGEKTIKELSPYKSFFSFKRKNDYGKMELVYKIAGVSQLDYLALYKKFTFQNRESYTLDFISNLELGEKKIDISDHDNLFDLYENDFKLFVDYNIKDAELVEKLENKLKLLEIGLTLAYFSKVNYEDILSPMRYWENIIQNYFTENNIVEPINKKERKKDKKFKGAYVKEPVPGRVNYLVSFDYASLYPNVLKTFNISPETLVDYQEMEVDDILTQSLDLSKDYENDYVIAANGARFRKDVHGFIPILVDRMLNLRKEYKNKMLEAKKEIEKLKLTDPDSPKIEQLQKDVIAYNNKQMVAKVAANSFYGICGLEFFRFFDTRIAEAVTTSAQGATKFTEKYINEYLNRVFKFDSPVDFISASDTDSLYINLGPIIEKLAKDKTPEQKLELVKKIGYSKLAEKIDEANIEYQKYLNVYEPALVMKLEAISDHAVFIAKKKYFMSVVHFEGVDYTTPQLKMTGVEAIKTGAVPKVCREALEDCINLILFKTEDDLIQYVKEFKEKWNSFEPHEIAFPKGITNLEKYFNEKAEYLYLNEIYTEKDISLFKSKCPIHIRSSITYNYLLKKYKLEKFYSLIKSGSKIKYIYLKDKTTVGDDVIGFPNKLPKEFNLHNQVDYNKQFNKAFISPLEIITKPVGWSHEKKMDLFSYFS